MKLVLVGLLTAGLWACGESGGGGASTGGSTGQGGTTQSGGSAGNSTTSSSGGTPGAGGSSSSGGTTSGSGGSSRGTGGNSTGGASSGTGGGSGGSSGETGGAATGGTRNGTGGSSVGGAATGGAGASGRGGASTGGATASAGTGGGSSLGGQGGRGGTGGTADAGLGGTGGGGGSTLPPVTDYSVPGPFATTTDLSTGPDGKSTVFRPKTLGENGFLHAPIVFGPGIGMQATQLKDLLLSFASHGFVVVGTAVLNGGPNDPGNRTTMLNALNWIIQQNSQAGIYQGKLDVKHAVSMGYSVGGTAAVEIGSHEAVATVVSIHGHTATSALHGPMLQTSGTGDTVGLPMQQKTYDQSKVQTFLGTVSGADHGYIQQNTGGVQRPAIVAWMRYWIYNDTGAKRFFWGNDCVLCVSPWTNPQRKNWQ